MNFSRCTGLKDLLQTHEPRTLEGFGAKEINQAKSSWIACRLTLFATKITSVFKGSLSPGEDLPPGLQSGVTSFLWCNEFWALPFKDVGLILKNSKVSYFKEVLSLSFILRNQVLHFFGQGHFNWFLSQASAKEKALMTGDLYDIAGKCCKYTVWYSSDHVANTSQVVPTYTVSNYQIADLRCK